MKIRRLEKQMNLHILSQFYKNFFFVINFLPTFKSMGQSAFQFVQTLATKNAYLTHLNVKVE